MSRLSLEQKSPLRDEGRDRRDVRASLDDGILRDVIASAIARRREQQGSAEARRPIVARELHAAEQRITRLVDAIASAGPVEELLERLRAERARKVALVEAQRGLMGSVAERAADLRGRVTAVVAELRRHLGVKVARTRQLLHAILPGPVAMVPIVEDGRRGYRFTGQLRLDGLLLAGEGIETRHAVVAPTGFDGMTSWLEVDFRGVASVDLSNRSMNRLAGAIAFLGCGWSAKAL